MPSDAEREAWWPDEGPWPQSTHEIIWRPTFRVRLAVAPWEDPEEMLAEHTLAWDRNLEYDHERGERHAGEWRDLLGHDVCINEFINEGSENSIRPLEPREAAE